MEWIPYVMVAVLVAGDLMAAQVINKKRRALDPSKPEQAAQAKRLQMVLLMLHVQAAAMAALILLVIKPMLLGAP